MWEAQWNGTTVAEAVHLTRVSGRELFPVTSVRSELLRETGIRPGPPGFGPETTFDVVVDGRVARHGARCYRDPTPDHLNIKNLISFSPDVAIVPVTRPAPTRAARRWGTALFEALSARPVRSVARTE